jgi:hypothetical protein
MRYHFGIEHPDRLRSKILARLRRTRRVELGKTTKLGTGTESILASVALPLLVAEADRQESLAKLIEDSILSLKMELVLARDLHSATEEWRVDTARRFTTNLEDLARKQDELSVDKGRVVRVDGPWAQVALGDPRTDSYRLERVNAEGLAVADLCKEGQPFVRVLIHEKERLPRPVYLPAWEPETGPSAAQFEVILRAEPAKPLADSSKGFRPRKRRG